MKTLAVLLIAASASVANALTITEDTVIDDDTTYAGQFNTVIEDGTDGPTTVQIVGDGNIPGFIARQNTRVSLDGDNEIFDGGNVSFWTVLEDSARFDIYGGVFWCSESACMLPDPTPPLLTLRGQSEAHLHGGLVLGGIELHDSSEAHIYGRSLRIEQGNVFPEIRGELSSGDPLFIPIYPGTSVSHIILHEIPEPVALLLAVSGFGVALATSRHGAASLLS